MPSYPKRWVSEVFRHSLFEEERREANPQTSTSSKRQIIGVFATITATLNVEGNLLAIFEPVETRSLDGNDLEAEAAASAAAQNSGIAPVQASPQNAAPEVVTGADGISNENNFDAVSAQRDIEDDAALIAQNRAQYQVIAPTDLPPRPNSSAPNIVAYALQTTNPKGVPLYDRSGRYDGNPVPRACGAYNSSDLAQEAFLSMGGPQRDRRGLDPDGDGFACAWDPAPFRAARGG